MMAFISETNVPIQAFQGAVHCDRPTRFREAMMANGIFEILATWVPAEDVPQTDIKLNFQNADWYPRNPLLIIASGDGLKPADCHVTLR